MNDIKIEINNKQIDLTFDEGLIVLEKLYDVFKPEDFYEWERSLGIIPISEIIDNFNTKQR